MRGRSSAAANRRHRRSRRCLMVEPLLAVDNVSCWFGGLKAVDGASLTAPPDRITALIGPNGAGKTTLFSIISGFVRAREGTIRYAGEEITGKPPHELARLGIARTFITGRAMPRLRLPTRSAAISA